MTVKVKKKKMTIGEPVPQLPIEKLAEAVSPSVWPPLFGEGKFENEAITFFHRIHCRECQRMEEQRRKEQAESGGVGTSTPSPGQDPVIQSGTNSTQFPFSPPTTVEDQSLQQTMDKNKESLKRKLLLRRSVTELVDQGIYPPLTAPAAYAEQRKQLERAQTGDLLRHKLKMRPDRQSLVQHHILEDTKVDPSLQDRQKLLKKAKLQDSLNDRLANRPGPLELVEGNILQTDPELKDAIIEGKLQFPKTSEMSETAIRHHFKEEPDDTSASEGTPSPGQSDIFSDAMSPSAIPTPPDIGPFIQSLQQSGVLSPQTFTLSQISSVSSPTFVTSPPGGSSFSATFDSSRFANTMSPPLFSSGSSTSSQGSSNGANSRLAKLKKKAAKTPPKRVIKFHEYKGPPNIVKNQPSPPPMPILSGDTPYHILLQQQQLLLQWQLETNQSKKLPIFLSTAQKQVLTAAATGMSSPDGGPQLLQAQQIQVQQVGQSSVPAVQTATQAKQTQVQKVTQIKIPKPTATIITPVGTPIPVTSSSVPMSHVAPPPTIVANIPAAIAANAIPTYRPLTAVASLAPVVTTIIKTLVTNTPLVANTSLTTTTAAPKPAMTNSIKSNNNNNSSRSTSNSISRPPVTKLDDLKVAELRAECRKRSLPVSGPKPNLLEKLKQFAEEIVAEFRNNNKNNEPVRSISSISSVSSLSNSENSLTSPPSVQNITNFANFINIQPLTPIDDTMSMTLGSPPMSPDTSVPDLTASSVSSPMSPDNPTEVMSPATSIASQQVTKDNLSSSQSSIPMAVDQQSRPPSVVPMDVELNSGNTNQTSVSSTDMNQNQKPAQSPVIVKTVSHSGVPTGTSLVLSPISTQTPPAPPPPPLPPPVPPLPPNAQIITIRPQSTIPTLTHTIPGAATAQIHVQGPLGNTTLSAQIRAQLLQQITAQMVRFPNSPMMSAIPVASQPGSGTITIAQPRPMLTQVSQPTTLTKTVAVVPQQQSLIQTAPQLTQIVTSVQTAAMRPSPSQISVPNATSKVSINQVRMPQVSVATSQKQSVVPTMGNTAIISNEELVKQQQKKIEDMTKQLLQYQMQLQQQSEQLKLNIAQAQIQGPEQAKAQQQAQQQAQALAQTQAHVQALTQVQVQAAAQLQAQTRPNALPSVQAPIQIQAQQQQQQQLQVQSKIMQTSVANQPAQNQQLVKHIQVQSPVHIQAQPPFQAQPQVPVQPQVSNHSQVQAQPQIQPQAVLVQQTQMLAPQRTTTPQTPSPRPQTAQQPVSQQTVLTQIQVQQVQSPPQSVNQRQVVSPAIPQTVTIQTPPQVTASIPGSNAIVAKTSIKPLALNIILQNPALQSFNIGQHKLVFTAMQPNGQQVLITSPPNMTSQGLVAQQPATTQTMTVAASQLAKVIPSSLNGVSTSPNNKSSSVPSSPVGHTKLVRSATNPFFTVPMNMMKEPPKYDEAVKNKQNVLLQQPLGWAHSSADMIITMPSSTIGTTSTVTSSTLAAIKSEYVDDVLDILIRSGELPPSAAQEPPPTPRVASNRPTHGMDTSTVPSQQSFMLGQPSSNLSNSVSPNPGLPASMSVANENSDILFSNNFFTDSKLLSPLWLNTTMPSASSISAANTVLSIANGLRLSGQLAFSNGTTMLTTNSVTPITTSASHTPHMHLVHSSPAALSTSVTSPLSNHGSPLDSDSGVGSSVGRKDVSLPLSISPAISNTNSTDLPPVLAESTIADFPPFMDWSDTDIPDNLLNTPNPDLGETDMCVDGDDKDLLKQIGSVSSCKTDNTDLNIDDFFKTSGLSTTSDCYSAGLFSPLSMPGADINIPNAYSPNPGPSSASGTTCGGHSTPNLRDLGFNDMDMMDATNAMNIDVSDWLDVVMPPSGLTPTTTNPPSNTFSADPILTPKTQEFLDLFNLVESDLYTPTDMGLTFEKAMEASTSKS